MSVHTKYADPQVTRGPVEILSVSDGTDTVRFRPVIGTSQWTVNTSHTVVGPLDRADLEFLLHRLHQLHEDLRMVEQSVEVRGGC